MVRLWEIRSTANQLLVIKTCFVLKDTASHMGAVQTDCTQYQNFSPQIPENNSLWLRKQTDTPFLYLIVSKTSPMPTGLFDRMTKEEILDLVAYVFAKGDKKHKLFAEHHKH